MSPEDHIRLRDKAAHFYYSDITGAVDDWIDNGINPGDIDQDVIDLYHLLCSVYQLGQKSKIFNGEENYEN